MPPDISDLMGNSASADSGALQATQRGIDQADGVAEVEETERKLVDKIRKEWLAAREFDKPMRDQFAIDRKYAAGKADPAWASDANVTGSLLEILVSFLYAKNPDVGARPPPRVGSQPDKDAGLFAETVEIIISQLWKRAKLKRAAKKTIRSTLTVGQGWFKAVAFSQTKKDPQVEGRLRDAQTSLQRLQAMEDKLNDPYCPPADRDVQIREIELQVQDLQAKLQKVAQAGLHIDFVRADDMQVSLDVSDIADYLEADWVSNSLYVPTDALKERFPKLTEEDVKKAAVYYQRKERDSGQGSEKDADGAYTKSQSGSLMGGAKPVTFACIIELWDKRDGMVKTFIEGIDKWAVDPYAPPQASSRYYPYFLVALFETDGERAPQSLCERLKKLQDEYSAARSGQRLTRERNLPGIVFNRGQVTPEDAARLEASTHMEYVGIQPTEANVPLQNIIMAKPSANIDVRMWDTTAILSDMQMISGVQEALAQGTTTAKTATEAGIEQSGFQTRTSTDRDTQEDVFRDFAQYSLEVAIQEVPPEIAKRIAGPEAFWPYGMDVEDILSLVEVDIDAGSTGKPNMAADRESWGIILPQVKETMVQYRQMQLTDPEMAACLRNLLRETLRRLDDRLDIDQILPAAPPALALGGPGALPGAPGLPAPGAPATVNPSTPMPPAGVTPVST